MNSTQHTQSLGLVALLLITLPLVGCGGPQILDAAQVCETCDDCAEPGTFEGTLNRDTEDFQLPGGVSVILKRTPGNPVVAIRLFVAGGARNLTAETSGIEALALDVATQGGTVGLARADLSARLNGMGSAIGANTALDSSSISAHTLRVYFEETWALFDAVLNEPAFTEHEVERIRQLHVQAVRTRQDSPDDRVSDAARSLLFEGHPYENLPRGTEETLQAFTADQLAAYYEGLLRPDRLLLVVVGDLTREDLEAVVGQTFSGLESTHDALSSIPPFPERETRLSVEDAQIPTNYVLGLAPAPGPTDDDYAAMVLATRHLSDRLFEEVRTVRNLSYAVSARMGARLANYAYFYVTAVDPQATIPVIYDEIVTLQSEPLEISDLSDQIAMFVTRHYTALDSNAAVAGELGWWELFGGGRENADTYVARLRAVTPEDVQRVAGQYLTNFQVAVVGDPDLVALDLFHDP